MYTQGAIPFFLHGDLLQEAVPVYMPTRQRCMHSLLHAVATRNMKSHFYIYTN